MMKIVHQIGDSCLIYDTDDIENVDLSVSVDPIEIPSRDGGRHYEAGRTHLTLQLDFKPGKSPHWINVKKGA